MQLVMMRGEALSHAADNAFVTLNCWSNSCDLKKSLPLLVGGVKYVTYNNAIRSEPNPKLKPTHCNVIFLHYIYIICIQMTC